MYCVLHETVLLHCRELSEVPKIATSPKQTVNSSLKCSLINCWVFKEKEREKNECRCNLRQLIRYGN